MVIHNMLLLYVHKSYCFFSYLIISFIQIIFFRSHLTQHSLLAKLYIFLFRISCNAMSHYRSRKITRITCLLVYSSRSWFLSSACFVYSCDCGRIAIRTIIYNYISLFYSLVTYVFVTYSYYDLRLYRQNDNITTVTHSFSLPMFHVTRYGFNVYNDKYCNSMGELKIHNLRCISNCEPISRVYLDNVITNIYTSIKLYSYYDVNTLNNHKACDVYCTGLFFIYIWFSKPIEVFFKFRGPVIVTNLTNDYIIINYNSINK